MSLLILKRAVDVIHRKFYLEARKLRIRQLVAWDETGNTRVLISQFSRKKKWLVGPCPWPRGRLWRMALVK